MAPRTTILGNNVLRLDWDLRDPDGIINAKAQNRQQWEGGVNNTLIALYSSPPCQTSAAVIDEIVKAGTKKSETVTIVPWTRKSWEMPIRGLPDDKLNSGAVADDKPGSTVSGKLSDELPDSVLKQIAATPEGPQRDKLIASYLGTGSGSSSKIYFTAQDWAPSTQGAGLDAADETLLHELVHSLRQEQGQEDPDTLTAPFAQQRQAYSTLEDFAAIVITNIYRSENGRQGLRRHHLSNPNAKDDYLFFPLTNARNFLTMWRPQLQRLQAELPVLCRKIAEVDCHFNPFFELYVSQNRFAPGTRRVAG